MVDPPRGPGRRRVGAGAIRGSVPSAPPSPVRRPIRRRADPAGRVRAGRGRGPGRVVRPGPSGTASGRARAMIVAPDGGPTWWPRQGLLGSPSRPGGRGIRCRYTGLAPNISARTGWPRGQRCSWRSVVASTPRHPSQRLGVANRLAMTVVVEVDEHRACPMRRPFPDPLGRPPQVARVPTSCTRGRANHDHVPKVRGASAPRPLVGLPPHSAGAPRRSPPSSSGR